MSGKTMAQRVRRAACRQAHLDNCLATDLAYGVRTEWPRLPSAREEPLLGPGDKPVTAEDGQQAWRQQRQALVAAFAVSDTQDHALGVDIVDAEAAGFADAESARVASEEHRTILGRLQGVEQGCQ